MVYDLHNKGIKGFFFVRQQRIPTILCQGFSIGVDKSSYLPMIYDENDGKYIIESFKDKKGVLVSSFKDRLLQTESIQSSGLLSVDVSNNRNLQSFFDTSEFVLEKVLKFDGQKVHNRSFIMTKPSYADSITNVTNLLYVDQDVPQKIYQDMGFSTKAGLQEDLKYNAYFRKSNPTSKDAELVRGLTTSFIGTTSKLDPNSVYNVRIKNYNSAFLKEYFEIRMNDNSPYYATSERYCISPKEDATDYSKFKNYSTNPGNNDKDYNLSFDVFRGDCFTSTVTIRMQRNFISASVPVNDTIVDANTWKNNFNGVRYTTSWDKINKADVDAVPIGH